jgi:glutaredoxin
VSDPRVMLYALSTCPWCRKTKQYLQASGVDFEWVDVDTLRDEDYERVAQEAFEISGSRAYPVLRIGDAVVVGYHPERYAELLGRKE